MAKLFNCDCEYQEILGTGTAKGYVLVSECDACKAKREASAILEAKSRRKQEIISELNELDKKVIRPLLDGETDRVDAIKAEKVALRAELATL
jgi:hypothetical protein